MQRQAVIKPLSIIIIIGVLIIAGLFLLPNPVSGEGKITILDRNGKELFSLQESTQKSTWAKYEEIPQNLIISTLVAEDKNFFQHQGIDWLANLRALEENISAGGIVSGASTITQQLIRNILGTNRVRTITNKVSEMLLASVSEKILSKEQILEQYFNTIFYGYNSYGIAKAAEWYFNKDFRQLDWNQATFLAVMPQNTAQLNPYTNLEAVRKRQAWLVGLLLENKHITQEEADFILQNPPTLASPFNKIIAPHFVHFVMQELATKLGDDFWHGHEVKITTTLNSELYQEAKASMNQQLADLDKQNVHNAGSLILDNNSGEIVSYVGNNDYFDSKHAGEVDMVQALRQPGSAIKPFIYLGAIFKGWGTGTIIYDVPSRFQTAQDTPYTPLNYDLDYHGPVTVREALANSYNIPAVKTLDFLGISTAKGILAEAGISSLTKENEHYGLSLALGSGEVSLYQLTNAYRSLAKQGMYSVPVSIKSISIDGKTIETEKSVAQAIWHKNGQTREQATTLLTDILSDNYARSAQFGENSVLEFPFSVAAKTGTSRNFNDNWTLGYSSDYTIGVWVGNSDGEPMNQVSGITGAGPIFHDLMSSAQTSLPQAFSLDSIPPITICLPSGLLPNEYCTHKSNERFLPNTEPTQIDTWYSASSLTMPKELSFWQSKFANTVSSEPSLKIISPQNHDVFTFDPEIPDDKESIPCKIYSKDITNVQMKLNQEPLSSCALPKENGNYVLQISGTDPKGQTITDTVAFSIVDD